MHNTPVNNQFVSLDDTLGFEILQPGVSKWLKQYHFGYFILVNIFSIDIAPALPKGFTVGAKATGSLSIFFRLCNYQQHRTKSDFIHTFSQ